MRFLIWSLSSSLTSFPALSPSCIPKWPPCYSSPWQACSHLRGPSFLFLLPTHFLNTKVTDSFTAFGSLLKWHLHISLTIQSKTAFPALSLPLSCLIPFSEKNMKYRYCFAPQLEYEFLRPGLNLCSQLHPGHLEQCLKLKYL